MQALEACRKALVGTGHFEARVDLPEQAPLPTRGRALPSKSSFHGHQALVAHVYGTRPLPTTQIMPMRITHSHLPGFDVTISATLPKVGND